jgi:hypothetical protein
MIAVSLAVDLIIFMRLNINYQPVRFCQVFGSFEI